MSDVQANGGREAAGSAGGPPPLARDARGAAAVPALADVVEWFLEYDPRVNVVRSPRVEELFQWKQQAARDAGEEVYQFENAEARLAVGIVQAVVAHADERALHEWIGQLLNALDEAQRTAGELARDFKLDPVAASTVAESAKLPAARGREIYLTCSWLEVLCTAEVRVLGWVYQELYGRAFDPNNF
jgi:hypothetical protein